MALEDDLKPYHEQSYELILTLLSKSQLGRRKSSGTGRESWHGRTNVWDRDDSYRSRNLARVVRKVIVVRVVAKDSATTASEAQLADDIFGANGDMLNLKSGYDSCSNGLLQFEPLSTNELIGSDGVLTVNLPNTTISGASDENILYDVLGQATKSLGIHPSRLADHVMVCIPPGTVGNWISYASVNSWMSVFNDKWCQSYSGQMHEIGKSGLSIPCYGNNAITHGICCVQVTI